MREIPVMDCGDGVARADNGADFQYPIVAKTAAYTIRPVEAGKAFSNAGATGSVTFTLPPPKVGLKFHFIKVVQDQNLIVDVPSAVQINDQTAGKNIKNITTEVGLATLTVVGISATEYVIKSSYGAWVGEDDAGTAASISTAGVLSLLNINVASTARTATAAGTGTGTIAAGTGFVTVTCDDPDKIIILPAPTPGVWVILHVVANGYELRTSDPATIGINGGTGSAAESAIAADTTVFMFCATATSWKGWQSGSDGTLAKVQVAAP